MKIICYLFGHRYFRYKWVHGEFRWQEGDFESGYKSICERCGKWEKIE